ncbi:hypothetical protein DFH08DRAFT_1078021 [Mycena albidolilacea]|uniref:MYND-type domain-containing protein n=1 Tax=Mycena albidolilacea TaxID=1033008 RepID=A0AAD7A9H3_9AGAR|nr:hypothetical protein DFH08DRAFT_1078021 [Mycena albidolilacea]
MASNALLGVPHAIQSLQDPNNPTFCCRYYICLLSQIEPEDAHMRHNWENPIILHALDNSDDLQFRDQVGWVADSTSLLDVLSAFITTNRSRADMAALARRMEHCECDRNDRLVDSMHAWEWNLTAYCRDPDGRPRLPGPPTARPSGLRWPRNRRQCLVGSDEAAATMLCRWLDVYPILSLLRVIAATPASFGRVVLVPFLLSAHLPKNLVAILKRGVDSLPPDFGGDFNPFGSVYPITLVFTMMKELVSIDDGGLSMGGIIHAKLVLPFDEVQYHTKILASSQRCRTIILDVQKPHELARNVMLTLAELPPQCMSAKCAKPAPESLCSACRRVAYCNTECQSYDWNGPLPHKKNPIPPQLDVDEFQLAVQHAVPLLDVMAFNKYMIEDDRIRKVVNDKYSARYTRSLD